MKNSFNLSLLLHVCCAPCAGGIIETLVQEGVRFTLYFYNPNIYPRKEYWQRKNEIQRFAEKSGVSFIDEDDTADLWFERTKGLETEPERGLRCKVCFDMRLERAAHYAHNNGYNILGTTNGISRWKDASQVNNALINATKAYPGLDYLDRDWRKHGGMERMSAITKKEGFYRQTYCGCLYSLQMIKNKKTL